VLPIHKVSFIVWLAFTGLHVLGHVTSLPPALTGEYGRRHGGDGRAGRQLALALALTAGVALAVLLLPHYGAWQHAVRFHHERH
jgi:hypothetical protein